MFFRISVAAELGRPALAETALKQHRHPRFVASLHGDTLNAQAPLPKISIRSQSEEIRLADTKSQRYKTQDTSKSEKQKCK
jgi:hypothetical protein